jgi:hypothetical protein
MLRFLFHPSCSSIHENDFALLLFVVVDFANVITKYLQVIQKLQHFSTIRSKTLLAVRSNLSQNSSLILFKKR